MTTTLAYLWTPLAMALIAVGIGLLVERLARWPLPSALLAPVGGATAIVATTVVYRLHGNAVPAAIVVVVAALAGFALAHHDLRERLRPGWAGVSALLAYLLFVGPSLLTGHWTWAGYNFVNDTSVNLLYVDLLARHGYTVIAPASSTTTLLQASGVSQHYPMGAHGLAATLMPLTGLQAAAVYQPFVATVAAGAAAALTLLANRAGVPGPLAAVLGLLSAGANLTYQYSQHGAIKEITVVLLVCTSAAVAAAALDSRVRGGFGAVLALCLAPIVLVLSVGGVIYALLGAVLAVAAFAVPPRRLPLRVLVVAASVGIVTAVVATGPLLGDVVAYARGAGTSFEGGGGATATPSTFGHLLGPLPATHVAGVYLGEDYRKPVPQGTTQTLQTAFTAVILFLAAAGLIAHLTRRRFGAPMLLVTCGLTAAIVAPRVTPYADAKLLMILSPAVVLAAGIGIWELSRLRLHGARAVAAIVAIACGGAVLYSDATAGHEVRLAPTDRMGALEDAAKHAGGGYWLVNEWEEFAKYFARSIRSDSGSESESPDVVVLRTPEPIFGRYFDLDEQALDYIHRFDGIIARRSPVASRPPGDYRRVYANDYYELWRRDRAVTVREHLPLGGLYDAAGKPSCRDVRLLAGRARKQGDVLVAAPRAEVPVMDVINQADRSPGWVPDPTLPRLVNLNTPGHLRGSIRTFRPGRYRAWLQLTSGRPMELRIDGRLIGSPHQVNSPQQWLEAGVVRLAAGVHRVELHRRGGLPLPGDGYNGELGPLALEPVAADRASVRVDPRDASSLCGRRWDWIEDVAR